MSERPFPTLDHVWVAAALALIALRPMLLPISPHDFWWHMATGRHIVQSGHIPRVDVFSYTQYGSEFYNQGWLAQVMLYVLHSLGGVPLILLTQSLVVVLAYALLLWLCVRRSGGALRLGVGVLLLSLPLAIENWSVRPQSYALPLFVAFLVILTTWRTGQGKPRLWLLPPLMVIWVNLHGSFMLGGALVALTFIGEGARRGVPWLIARRFPTLAPTDAGSAKPNPPLRSLFIWGAITAAALLVNPRGIGVIGYVFNLLSASTVTTLAQEWAPPTIRSTTGTLFFVYVMVVAALLAYARRPPDLVDMLLAGPFFWLALGAERSIIWFTIVITPLLAAQAATLRPTGTLPQPAAATASPRVASLINATLIGFLALLLVLGLPWIKPHLGLPPTIGPLLKPETPVQAVETMRNETPRPRHLFHTIGTGSYLTWAAPDQPVFIDTRFELYPLSQWQDYFELNAGMNVERLITAYDIDGLLLDNDIQAGLLAAMQDNPAWDIQYADKHHTYLVRREPPP
jgi:hypothetical protein